MERLQKAQTETPRKNFGIRFLKPHQIKWMTSSETLKKQTGLSLVDRCKHFQKEFSAPLMNTALLKRVYARYGIRKKKYRYFK